MIQRIIWTFCLGAAISQAQTGAIEQRFAQARKNPGELYAFLVRMPKGGDLHNHLSGAVYAESYLRSAAEDGLCVDLKNYSLVAPPCGENGVPAARAQMDNGLANALIDSLSMRNFVPGRESGHDHFFATFGKFGPVRAVHRGEFLAEVIRRAAEQNESYLELMAINGGLADSLGSRAGFDGDFEAAKDKLMNGLPEVVRLMHERVDEMDRGRLVALGCDSQPDSAPCRVVVRYQYEVLRESPKEQVFAQVLAGLMLCATDARVVSINLVQPEDGLRSMRDYHLQMQMLDYAKRLYPNVHVTLHAGELAAGLVPPDGLRFHIREAIELGHAERIGHGVDVMQETDAAGLLGLMKKRRILVEINLTSNDLILGVRGNEHPFPVYRKYGVPVAPSTDDEGVSRSHLTEEYRRAVLTYGLSYSDVKEMVRNSLEYSFLPGASYWQDHAYRVPVAACAGGARTTACQTLLNGSDKARLQADLEDRLREFER
jgi:adenosine deaminase